MDSFEKHGLDNDTFGEKSSGGIHSFDAFPRPNHPTHLPARQEENGQS